MDTDCRYLTYVLVSVAVLVIVGGQPTTDDDTVALSLSQVDRLWRKVAELEAERTHDAVERRRLETELAGHKQELVNQSAELAKALSRISTLEDVSTSMKPTANDEVQTGASYVRWGRKTCNGNSSLVYDGHAAGPRYNQPGGGSNYLCLPEAPQWNTFINGDQTSGSIAGVEYELFNSGSSHNNIFSERNNNDNPLAQNPAPCAVCYVGGRSTVLMIPAKTQCLDGWTTEYSGYLVSEHSPATRHRSSYICLDEAPEVAIGGTAQNNALFYPVEVHCGSLPCSVYPTGRELTCVVCSK